MINRNSVVAGLAMVMLAATVWAQSDAPTPGCTGKMGGEHHHRGGGRLVHLLLHATDLTPEQQVQAKAILEAKRPAMKDQLTQLRRAKSDLAILLLGVQPPPPAAIAAQQEKIAQIHQQMAQRRANTVLAIRAILTPDQLAKALAAKDQPPADGHQGHKGREQHRGKAN